MNADVDTQIQRLPVLGVGLSLSFGMKPDPVALAAAPGGPAFVEYAGAVQHDWVAQAVKALAQQGVPVLYHPSCLNLCGPWPNPRPWLEAVRAHVEAVDSAWLAQDVAICFVGESPGYSIDLGYFIPPILDDAGLAQAVERVEEVKAVVDRPLLLEPAPVTFQLGDRSIFQWLGALAERTGCGLLLDAGHVVSHQLALGNEDDLGWGLTDLDLSRVVEVHVAGGVIEERQGRFYYLDAHDLPVLPEVWAVFEHLVASCPNLKAVCLECEGAVAEAVLPVLHRARQVVARSAANPALREVARGRLSAGGR